MCLFTAVSKDEFYHVKPEKQQFAETFSLVHFKLVFKSDFNQIEGFFFVLDPYISI